MRRALAVMVLWSSAPATACFSPSYERCAIACAAGECPPDTYCLGDGRCHARPDEPLCVAGEIIDAGGDAGGAVDAGPDAAELDAGVPVTPTEPGHLVVSEIFRDPIELDEVNREWFEIYNPTDLRFELMGLEVRDDMGQTFDVETSVVLAPQRRVVFARNGDIGMNGGVDADYDYDDDFALGNDDDVIEIVHPLGDVTLDLVEYGTGPAGWPNEEGASMNLDPAEHDAASNDLPTSWCEASSTPGAANPDC